MHNDESHNWPEKASRLLVVDDDASTLHMMKVLLSGAGYETLTAGSVAEALDVASAAPPDVLLTDLGLPDATGAELLGELKRLYAVSGVALSGYAADQLSAGEQEGFAAHLVKPVDFNQLKAVLAGIFDQRRRVGE